LLYFSGRVSDLCPGWSGQWPSYLCFLYSWGDTCVPPHPATGWDRVLLTFCSGWPQNHNPSDLCLPRSWDYRCESLHLVLISHLHTFLGEISVQILYLFLKLDYLKLGIVVHTWNPSTQEAEKRGS
jgi:hypothetical protein